MIWYFNFFYKITKIKARFYAKILIDKKNNFFAKHYIFILRIYKLYLKSEEVMNNFDEDKQRQIEDLLNEIWYDIIIFIIKLPK